MEPNCFREMFIHHMTTILLMVMSWSTNLTRVGTLVLLIHDCADIFLEVRERALKKVGPRLRDQTSSGVICRHPFQVFKV